VKAVMIASATSCSSLRSSDSSISILSVPDGAQVWICVGHNYQHVISVDLIMLSRAMAAFC
jgi:hypothetical protein